MTFNFVENFSGFSGFLFGSLKSNTFIITHLKLATQSLQNLTTRDKSFFYFGLGVNDDGVSLDLVSDMSFNNISMDIVYKKLLRGLEKKEINFVFIMKNLDNLFLSSFGEILQRITNDENFALYNHYNNTNLNFDELRNKELKLDLIDLYGEFFNKLFQLMPNIYYDDHLYTRFSNNLNLIKILNKKYNFDNFRLVDIKNLNKFINSEYKTTILKLHQTPDVYLKNVEKLIQKGYPNLRQSDTDFSEIIIKNMNYLYNLEKVSKSFLEKTYEYVEITDDKIDKKDS